MNNLKIYNSREKKVLSRDWLKKNNFVLWETCVRQMVIGTGSVNNKELSEYEYYNSLKAYRFLLEVICGLHSPMIGETEILCQFKKFVSETSSQLQSDSIDAQFWNGLLKDAKKIRSKFLKSYGQQSYGGVVLKNSYKHKTIHIIGSGDLASSILTHLSRVPKQIVLQCRNRTKGLELKQKYSHINEVLPLDSQMKSDKTLLVVAAPISTENLELFLRINESKISGVIDLRSIQDHKKVDKKITNNYLDLDQVFKQVQSSVDTVKKNAKMAKIEIAKRSLLWPLRTINRPFGWEDVCA